MENLYGGPLRLAGDARALDVSPAWLSWVGQAPALELLEAVGIEAVHAHDLALAARFRAGLGLPSRRLGDRLARPAGRGGRDRLDGRAREVRRAAAG